MSAYFIEDIAIRFGVTFLVIQSWIEHKNLKTKKEALVFFEENEELIKAQPFVKWVGGKRQLIEQFQKLFPKKFNDYYEPFLGGGAVFFNIQKRKSYLSDMNAELINVYQIIKSKPEDLIKYLKSIEHSKETYLEIRAWDRVKGWEKKYNKVARAARFIYLNRTCFNGLHRVNSRGEFNVPMGAYKNPDYVQEENIRNTSLLLNKTEAEIKVESFEHVCDKAEEGDLIYFDPPYDVLSETANFTSYNKVGFGHDMQIKLAETFRELDKKGCFVMLSNHNTPFIRELYSSLGIKKLRFEIVQARRNVNRNSSGRGSVGEIVVLNY
ncbi:DNA adenine methylase [Candidatus Gracilibacteria bacterium]|nr:DNA adenine methylase [Candidatus Gracilibacteria bacterium]